MSRVLRSDQFQVLGCVDQLCSLVLPGLPHAERRPGRIGEDRHPAGVEDVERRSNDLSTCPGHPGGRFIGALDRDVGAPDRRRRAEIGRRTDRGDIATTQSGQEYRTGESGGMVSSNSHPKSPP